MSGAILAYGLVEVSPETMILSLAYPCRQRIPPKSADRVLQPYTPTARKRLGAATVGSHLAARGGKQAKSKAVVAVARKLAVLLHHLWSTQEPYMPFYEQPA